MAVRAMVEMVRDIDFLLSGRCAQPPGDYLLLRLP
jgi:hypothetical protein